MAPYSDKQQREAFHCLFLEKLLRSSNPALYVLKGGINLRFFFNSPRYSEDMDLDVLGGAADTLKKNAYKILQDSSFHRVLKTFGIDEIKVSDPAKAKQTETTQRFKVRLVNTSGEEFPTKVEFSRRANADGKKQDFVSELIPPEVVAPYRRLTFTCQHYAAAAAVIQKLGALAGRSVSQARDPFDLYILYLGGKVPQNAAARLSRTKRDAAIENLLSLSYDDYVGQVVEYLAPEDLARFESRAVWAKISSLVLSLLEVKAK